VRATYPFHHIFLELIILITSCYNFNSRNDHVKENLLICALEAAVAYEIIPLWSCALRETILPLPEAVLKIVFWNTSQ
jgi:hypothetical protein